MESVIPSVSPRAMPLRKFQDAFARALMANDGASPVHTDLVDLVEQPAFSVYRNTVLKGCIDALQASYPSVARLVGEEWFRAAAAVYARQSPPATPVLLDYGDGFADFLRDFPPAQQLPYLAGVAQLDRAWTEAHVAADREPVEPAAIAALTTEQLGSARLRPHPTARWSRWDDAPIFSIWQRNRLQLDDTTEFEWVGEAALLTRPNGAVSAIRIDAAACVFLDACAAGEPLARAAMAALERDPTCDLSRTMTVLLDAGAFGALYFKELS